MVVYPFNGNTEIIRCKYGYSTVYRRYNSITTKYRLPYYTVIIINDKISLRLKTT